MSLKIECIKSYVVRNIEIAEDRKSKLSLEKKKEYGDWLYKTFLKSEGVQYFKGFFNPCTDNGKAYSKITMITDKENIEVLRNKTVEVFGTCKFKVKSTKLQYVVFSKRFTGSSIPKDEFMSSLTYLISATFDQDNLKYKVYEAQEDEYNPKGVHVDIQGFTTPKDYRKFLDRVEELVLGE